jgi:hypothetical protein
VIRTLVAPFGSAISLDFRGEFGESIELESFQFVTPRIEFRLVRDRVPLQEWQAGNTEMYDLQHCPGVKEWSRARRWIINDMDHRHDVARLPPADQSVTKRRNNMLNIAGPSQALEEVIDTRVRADLNRAMSAGQGDDASSVAFVGFAVWRREENGDANLCDEQVFVVRDGKVRLLDPRMDLELCSPDGLSWGYPGSGPAQLAVAMLMEVLGDPERVQRIRHQFHDRFVARIPQNRNWTADGADILAIALEIEQEQAPAGEPDAHTELR